jgi:hypothetical protein
MPISRERFDDGIRYYWREIGQRAAAVQAREKAFPDLAARFASRTPPHFGREDLVLIMEWKHTDPRWRDRAITGIKGAADALLLALSAQVAQSDTLKLVRAFEGKISGVGVASVSAIAAAGRPDLYPVIDDFGLKAIAHYYDRAWVRSIYRDKKSGNFQPTYRDYVYYVEFCRATAAELTEETGQPWTPRMVDMGCWGVGKKLAEEQENGGGGCAA